MFSKKRCKRCESKVKEDFSFCPKCGLKLNSNSKNWGMLGKNDFIEEESFMVEGMGAGIFNKMLTSTMKMLEKELNKEVTKEEKQVKMPRTKIKLMINGKEVNFNTPPQKKKREVVKEKLPESFSQNKIKQFQVLEKQEPKTNIRRIGDNISYEIDVPGVKSIDDVSITKMESGFEVKAISKNKAYLKNILIKLPLIDYSLSNGKLVLEMNTLEN